MGDPDWSRLPSLTTLRAFEATARLQGYSAAARALNVTPAAVAQQVRKLEAETGTALVRREGRGLALTQAGAALADVLSDGFGRIAKGFEDVRQAQATRGVQVSTTVRFVEAVILPGLAGFWKDNPRTQVSFSPEGNTAPVDLERFDIVIRAGPPGQIWEGCQSTPLVTTPIVICAAPGLLADGKPAPELPWIEDQSIGWQVFETCVRRAGCDPDRIRRVDPGGAKFELEAALMGYGLHVTPELTVRRQLQEGGLVNAGIATGLTGTYCALCRNGPLAPQVRNFLDWLAGLCRPLSHEG